MLAPARRLLAVLVLGIALCKASAGLSPPSTRLRSSATLSAREGAIVAKASPKAVAKPRPPADGQLSLVLNKISNGAAAAKGEAEKLAADAQLQLRSAYSKVEGTVKEHPAESAVAAVLAVTLAFLLGEGEAKAVPEKASIIGSIFSVGNQTTKALVAATGGCLEGPAAMVSKYMASLAKQVGPLVGGAINGTAALAAELALSLSACAVATPGALNKTLWAVEQGIVEVACAIANISLTLAGRCSDEVCAFGKAVGSWGDDLVSNTTFRVKNVGSALTAIVNPTALKYTVKSGSIKSGSFTVDLGTKKVLGAVIVENKHCKKRRNKDLALAGTHDFEIWVSEDGKEWSKAHRGSISPGAPKAQTQYVTFTGKWARYVKFLSVSSYKGGAGLENIYLHSPMGLNTLHWLLHFKDTVHSFYEANAPAYWSEIEMPPCTDVQSRIVYAPLLMSKYLGLSVPDDLWLANFTRAVGSFSEGCVKASKRVAGATVGAVNKTCSGISTATASLSAAASKIGIDRISGKVINGTASAITKSLSAVKSPFVGKKVALKDPGNSCLPVSVVGLLGVGGAYYYKEPIGEFVGPYADELAKQAGKVQNQLGEAVRDMSGKIQDASRSIVDSVEKASANARNQASKAEGGKGKSGAGGESGPRRFGKA